MLPHIPRPIFSFKGFVCVYFPLLWEAPVTLKAWARCLAQDAHPLFLKGRSLHRTKPVFRQTLRTRQFGGAANLNSTSSIGTQHFSHSLLCFLWCIHAGRHHGAAPNSDGSVGSTQYEALVGKEQQAYLSRRCVLAFQMLGMRKPTALVLSQTARSPLAIVKDKA